MELSMSSTVSFDVECTPSSSRTSTLTRGMSLMGTRELEQLCRQEFGQCDADGDGFITQQELQEQCGDDPELARMLMEAMDSDNDGQISFEDFHSSMLKVKSQLLRAPTSQSTPGTATSTPGKASVGHGASNFLADESIFESEPSTNECEEEWFKAMERIDPAGLVSSNTELKAVWVELMLRDPALLDRFESFLTEIVNTLELKQQNCQQVEQHIRKVLSYHTKEVLEMDGVLQDRLREASYQQQVECEAQQRKLSDQYQGLIQDKDEAIQELARAEESLRRQLDHHSQNEQELRQEKEMLLKFNQYLKEQLRASNKKLSLSQGLFQRLSQVTNNDDSCGMSDDRSLVFEEDPMPSANGSVAFGDLPLSPTSSSFSLSLPKPLSFVMGNPLPLDLEVKQALLSEDKSAPPDTPIQRQDVAVLPTQCLPQKPTESMEESSGHSEPIHIVSKHLSSSKDPSMRPVARHMQENGINGVGEKQGVNPQTTYTYETLPTNGLSAHSDLGRRLQADLVKYAHMQAHAESDEGRRRRYGHSKPFPEEISFDSEGAASLSHHQQQQQVEEEEELAPAVMVNGGIGSADSGSLSSSEGTSTHSWSLLQKPATPPQRDQADSLVVEPSSFSQQQDQQLQANAGMEIPPNQNGRPSIVVTTNDDQEKKCEELTSSISQRDDVSLVSSLDSLSASHEMSPPTAISRLKPPQKHAHSSAAWAGQPAISVSMATPAVSLSTFITRRDDLPSASAVTPNRIFKVMFLGDSGVGKTSIIGRLSQGVFTANVRSTIGLDFAVAVIQVGEEPVAFQLWDTAGQERFQATTGVYLRRADAFVIVYDVTSRESFRSVRRWLTLVKAVLRNDLLPVVMIMGNKSDCHLKRMVASEEGHKLALELSALFSETSALSGDNVLHSQATLANLLLERQNNEMERIRSSMLQLDNTGDKKKNCAC